MAYYAYSKIVHDNGTVEYGEKVDQKTIGVTDEEWATYIEDNVVGEQPIPDDIRSTESLVNYNLRKAREDFEAAQAGEINKSKPSKVKSTKSEPASSLE